MWRHPDPNLLEVTHIKKVGGLVPAHVSSYGKLSAFSVRDDVVLSILKRGKIDSLDRVTLGTGVTHWGRLGFPIRNGRLDLDRLIMQPGGGSHLPTSAYWWVR
ncbi:MAG: hypothetical protein PVH41_14515 [Anaerolineae bacterium]